MGTAFEPEANSASGRSAMSDAALSERGAALETSNPSSAVKPAASKARRDWRAYVRSSNPDAGMETAAAAGKAGRGGRADVGNSNRAAGMETAAAGKAGRDGRADVGNSNRAAGMKPAASKTGRGRRADVGSSDPATAMEMADAAETVHPSANDTRVHGRGPRVKTGRRMNAAMAEATKT